MQHQRDKIPPAIAAPRRAISVQAWQGPIGEDIFLAQMPAMVGGQPTSSSSTRVYSAFAHTLPSQHLTRQSLSISLMPPREKSRPPPLDTDIFPTQLYARTKSDRSRNYPRRTRMRGTQKAFTQGARSRTESSTLRTTTTCGNNGLKERANASTEPAPSEEKLGDQCSEITGFFPLRGFFLTRM